MENLYKKTDRPPVFESIKGIIHFHGRKLTHEESMRLKGEALTLKGMFIYDYIANQLADEMQKEIVENHTEATPNGKDERTLDYYRAVLADRRILMGEIDRLASYEPPRISTDNTVVIKSSHTS